MTRLDFFVQLRQGLRKLPAQEIENAVRYYTEYFDDAGAEEEERVLRELGDPAEIAKQITAEYMVRDIVAYEKPKPNQKGLGAVWVAILALFASPIALPIAIAVAGLVFGLVIAAAAFLLSFWIIIITFIITGVAGILLGFVVMPVHLPTGICTVGTALFICGLGLLLFIPTNALTKTIFTSIARGLSNCIVRRKSV